MITVEFYDKTTLLASKFLEEIPKQSDHIILHNKDYVVYRRVYNVDTHTWQLYLLPVLYAKRKRFGEID